MGGEGNVAHDVDSRFRGVLDEGFDLGRHSVLYAGACATRRPGYKTGGNSYRARQYGRVDRFNCVRRLDEGSISFNAGIDHIGPHLSRCPNIK